MGIFSRVPDELAPVSPFFRFCYQFRDCLYRYGADFSSARDSFLNRAAQRSRLRSDALTAIKFKQNTVKNSA